MTSHSLDTTFAALADPTRRAILSRLSSGEATVTELASPFDMSLPAITKHLKVLERAGLIARGREAQWRPCRLKAAPLKAVSHWVEHYRRFWEESFDRLDDYLSELKKKEKKHDRKKDSGGATEISTSDRELVVTRTFDAPRELVWKAWTDPEHVVQWWGPKGFTTTIEVMDVRPGGIWKHVMHGPDGTDYPNRSVFLEVVTPERIVYSHGGGKAGGPVVQFESTWTFSEVGKQTKLTMKMLFKSAADRDLIVNEYGALEGGKQTLQRLAEHLPKISEGSRGVDKEPELVISRVFDAPRALVFKVWTDPKHVMKWWGPRNFTAPFCKIDLRPEGIFHFCMRSPDGTDYWNKGVYREIIVPEKIVSTMYFSDKDGNIVDPSHYGMVGFPKEMQDTVTFTELNANQTVVTLFRNHTVSMAKRYQEDQGWNQSLDRFAEELTKA